MGNCQYKFRNEDKCLCTVGMTEYNDNGLNEVRCILHRPRDNTKADKDLFYEGISDYLRQHYKYNDLDFSGSVNRISFIRNKYSDKEISFHGFFFGSSQDSKKFEKFIDCVSWFKRVDFFDCDIGFEKIGSNNVCFYFDNCNFLKEYYIENLTIKTENTSECVYKKCNFLDLVRFSGRTSSTDNLLIDYPVFFDCTFEDEIQISYTTFNKQIFYFSQPRFNYKITKMHFHDCIVKDRFSINDIEIEELYASDTSFLDKFEMKFESKTYGLETPKQIRSIEFENVKFISVADFHGVSVNKLSMSRVDFKQFAAFENIRVHCNSSAEFSYVTFHSSASFRGATFNGGLNIDRANFLGETNFLGIKDNNNSTRETYRIIKNSFDREGNHIEGNRFFALEMGKYFDEVKLSKSLSVWDRIVFQFNKCTSNFGQSYILGVKWLIPTAFIFYILTICHKNDLLYKIWPTANPAIELISKHLNGFADAFMPFKSFLREGMEFLSLIFYIIFVVLIWQIVISLKRHSRR